MAPHRPVRSNTSTTSKRRHHGPASELLWSAFEKQELHDVECREALEALAQEQSLVIPDDENCIDTIRLFLSHPVVHRDRAHLAKHGFELRKNSHRAKKAPDGQLLEPDPGSEWFVRESDACRVELAPTKCSVEVSLARLAGLPNYKMSTLTQGDVRACFHTIANNLLPWTTHLADLSDTHWVICRLDLAIDREADVMRFVDAYEFTTWPRVRKPPFPQRFKKGLWWRAQGRSRPHQLSLYDKGAQIAETKQHAEHGGEAPPDPGSLMRVERRWVGKVGLANLARYLEGADGQFGTRGFYQPVSNRDSARKVSLAAMNLRALHMVLANEISLLDGPKVVAQSKDELIALAYARIPWFRTGHDSLWSARTSMKIRKLAGQLTRQNAPSTLLHACYGSK